MTAPNGEIGRLVERLAHAICESDDGRYAWAAQHEQDREMYRDNARAVLADLGRWVTEQANVAHASRYGYGQEHHDFHSCPCEREAVFNLAHEVQQAALSGGTGS